MGFGEMRVDLLQEALLGRIPEVRVMTESAIELLSHLDHLFFGKKLAAMETIQGAFDAERVI